MLCDWKFIWKSHIPLQARWGLTPAEICGPGSGGEEGGLGRGGSFLCGGAGDDSMCVSHHHAALACPCQRTMGAGWAGLFKEAHARQQPLTRHPLSWLHLACVACAAAILSTATISSQLSAPFSSSLHCSCGDKELLRPQIWLCGHRHWPSPTYKVGGVIFCGWTEQTLRESLCACTGSTLGYRVLVGGQVWVILDCTDEHAQASVVLCCVFYVIGKGRVSVPWFQGSAALVN